MALDPGVYVIRSAVNGEAAGVNGLIRIAFQRVEVTPRGNLTGAEWEVSPEDGDGRVRLSIQDVYPYVRVRDGEVMASIARPEGAWTIQPASGDRFRIRMDGQDWCWTAPEGGKGPVTVAPESHAIAQLWTFTLSEQPAP
ncbi:hypothetical protein [Streptomyces sp. Y1]|uniref:Ricin B lectin domain-containing protein n=1 Tax=Streptomyces sp. Y1 TaxID=3238634 RepID=A0AB39TEZ3_9ACTN